MENDDKLIQACRRGDAGAWEKLLKQYERLVYSIPLNYGLSGDDAADIVQVTFTVLLQSLDSLEDNSHLAAWLATVARRHSWRLLERRRRESPSANEDLSEQFDFLPDNRQKQSQERAEMVEWLDQGLSLLDQRCNALLQALYFDPNEPSYQEVAEQLRMSVGSIGPTRARCLARLRELMEGL